MGGGRELPDKGTSTELARKYHTVKKVSNLSFQAVWDKGEGARYLNTEWGVSDKVGGALGAGRVSAWRE